VGVHDFTFEACSGFTRVTACRVAQPPWVAFVTRLRPGPLRDQAACQLPDLPTTIWVGLPPTGDPRRWGAHNISNFPDFVRADTLLHTGNIPAPYDKAVSQMVSVKSNDAHGNLQLTMAKSLDPGTGTAVFLLDADIDEDLEFFAHAQDLFIHMFSGGTHPFDVHEILFV